jgi:hypothetical protein
VAVRVTHHAWPCDEEAGVALSKGAGETVKGLGNALSNRIGK